ncbi:hypothetical protein SpCBS45565_g01120 [Spizellomyces sp. 'palustris']|nr:hypothetical protein SpCBS45565_g01120 [Spizellomyces sp. 'palustris']
MNQDTATRLNELGKAHSMRSSAHDTTAGATAYDSNWVSDESFTSQTIVNGKQDQGGWHSHSEGVVDSEGTPQTTSSYTEELGKDGWHEQQRRIQD